MNVHYIIIKRTGLIYECVLLCQEHEITVGLLPSTVSQLLETMKATPAVMKFLTTTRVVERQKVLYQKLEEIIRRREEAWRQNKKIFKDDGEEEKGNREMGGKEREERKEAREA